MGLDKRLNSWKAIGGYLNRHERTARRWEREGLPVHRHRHAKKASVYAYTSEIDAWWDNDRARLEVEQAVSGRRTTARPIDSGAYEAYLKGRYYWNKGFAQGLVNARGAYEEAIRRDPEFAPAYAGLADTYARSHFWAAAPLPSPRETFSKARSAAMKALELDDSLAEAHAALAYIKEAHDWDWAAADNHYKRAIALNPNHAGVRYSYALYLAIPRRFDEAFAQMRRAEQLDPSSAPIKRSIGTLYYWAREFDRAIAQFDMTLELEPGVQATHYLIALAYTRKGMYANAIAAHHNAMASIGKPPRLLALLAHAYGKAGQRNDALSLIAQLSDRAEREHVSGWDLAIAHMGLEDAAEALRWLERAFVARDPGLSNLSREPGWFDTLRPQPRFQDLLRRLRHHV